MEKLSLKWDHFQTNVTKTFGFLRQEQDFSDVTLVSEDEDFISAHKIVLAGSSEFFKGILKRTSAQANPLLYLSGISTKHLQFLLDFVYEGEVKIDQVDVPEFLSIAKKLKVEGLQEHENINEISRLSGNNKS